MTWPLSNSRDQERSERALSNRGIPVDEHGFYDHPAFLAEERKHPQFLEQYARVVEVRALNWLLEASRQPSLPTGAWVLAWTTRASLTITFPSSSGFEPRCFWSFDEGNFVAPHAIVVALPFGIVDITVRQQPYDSGQREVLPAHVLATEFQLDKWTK